MIQGNKLLQRCQMAEKLMPHLDGRRKKYMKSWNLTVLESVRKVLSQMMSISIPRHQALLDGSRSNFSQLVSPQIPTGLEELLEILEEERN